MAARSSRAHRTPEDLYGVSDPTSHDLTRREALRRGSSVAAGAAFFPTDFAVRLARIRPKNSGYLSGPEENWADLSGASSSPRERIACPICSRVGCCRA